MLWDLLESGDRRVRHTEQLAAHGYGRKRKGRCDAEVRRQAGAERKAQIGRYSTHIRYGTMLVHIERSKGRPECLKKVAEPASLLISRAQRLCSEGMRTVTGAIPTDGAALRGPAPQYRSKDHPIHVTRADRAALCQLMDTRSTQSMTTSRADKRGTDERSRMASKSST